VVLRLPGHQEASIRALDASGSEGILQPAGVGKEGRLQIAISVGVRPWARREGKDQGSIDRRSGPRRLGAAAETEMDEMAHLQSTGRASYDDMTYPDDSTLCTLAAKLMRRVR
jgi:hypothetical protein